MTPTLLRRLLDLFSVTSLINGFETDAKRPKDQVVREIVTNRPPAEILAWTQSNFECAKHHAHIFTLDRGMLRVPPTLQIRSQNADTIVTTSAYYLLDLNYKVTVRDDNEDFHVRNLEFKWPVKIEIRGTTVTLKLIIMEKRVFSPHLPADDRFVASERDLEESDIVESAVAALQAVRSTTVLDLNRGIKAIWASGIIDSRSVRFKTDVSTTTQQMDEQKYVKRDMPAEYNQLRRRPLLKTLFETMDGEAGATSYPRNFVIDAAAGSLTFPTYNEEPAKARHVVAEILSHN